MARWADEILIMPIGFKPITNHLSKTHIKIEFVFVIAK
jgi:hypothetical protein